MIEDHHIGPVSPEGLLGTAAAVGLVHLVAMYGEELADSEPDPWLVVDD
jgi:hypothetical protein